MTISKNLSFVGKTLAFTALTALASLAAATTVTGATDDFQSYSVGGLNSGNGGTGWAGAWQANNSVAGVVNPAVDLQGDRALAFTGNNNSAASRTLATSHNGSVVVDFQFQFSGTVDNNDFLGLWFGNPNGPNIGLKGNCGDEGCKSGEDLFVRTNGVGGSFLSGSSLVADTTYHVFAHLYKSSPQSSYNRFDAWLNPTELEMLTLTNPDANYSGASNISSFNVIGFRSANLDVGDSIKIDNLRIGQVVPEPGSLALIGLALAGLGWSRRKQLS